MGTRHHIKFVFLFCALTVPLILLAISPKLTHPRIGDKLTILKLYGQPQWIDSLSQSPDLSNVSISDSEQMKVWSPSKADSISYCVITRGREVANLIKRGDTVYQLNRILPGRTKFYDTKPVYGMPYLPVSNKTIKTHGTTNNIGTYQTFGNWSTSKIPGLMVIGFDGDTIRDVECVQTDISETLIYSERDTTLYSGRVQQWYAPGYRYPLLEHETGTLFSVEGDSLDHVYNWYAIDTSEQREILSDDDVNRLIRDRYENANSWAESNSGGGNTNMTFNNTNAEIYFDEKNNRIIINPSFALSDKENRAYLICDISGVVYAFGEITSEGLILSTEGYNSGTYLLHLSTSGEAVIYKFKI